MQIRLSGAQRNYRAQKCGSSVPPTCSPVKDLYCVCSLLYCRRFLLEISCCVYTTVKKKKITGKNKHVSCSLIALQLMIDLLNSSEDKGSHVIRN